MRPEISVVIPVFGCDDCLKPLHERLSRVMQSMGLDFELILVDDRGPGGPWGIICGLAEADPRVRGIKLSRNFGQHYAISAGIDHVSGRWLVVMDCDLQDRPEEIPRLWAKAQEGFDIVIGRRLKRRDGPFKKWSSWLFHRIWSAMTDQESDAAQGNFGLYSSKVVKELQGLPESGRLFPLLVRWLGFETATVDIDHGQRNQGHSGYSWKKLVSLAADGIISYSNKPLKLFIKVGFTISLLAFCFGVWIVLRYFLYPGQTLLGWSSIMVSLYFLSGLLLLGMGVLGVYVGRIFNQVKGRPLYVVSELTSTHQAGHEPPGH